eukprot:5238951-Pyramimonas_sp.AAC.1
MEGVAHSKLCSMPLSPIQCRGFTADHPNLHRDRRILLIGPRDLAQVSPSRLTSLHIAHRSLTENCARLGLVTALHTA